MLFNKEAVVKISSISNSNSGSWNLVKFLSEFFLVNFSRIVAEFWLWINGKTMQKSDFYDKSDLQICSIFLRLDEI